MFKALLVKEWKEKTLVAVFGLGLMAVLLAAFFAFGGDQDLRDLIPAGFMIIFFPFVALMLGAGAFETEHRGGAWAYLLSRPVGKGTIWLAKLAAPLSLMAGFWLLFLGLMAAVPAIGEAVSGFELPRMLEAGLDFFPMILISSFFYFSIAFALSILSERQFSLVFGSFFLGFTLQALMTYVSFQAEGRSYLSSAGLFPWLDAYRLALVLSGLAFLGASWLTFRKADFSQPGRKVRALVKYAAVFLAVAWGLSAAWATLRAARPEEFGSEIEVTERKAVFSTTRGLYRYDASVDDVRRLTSFGSSRLSHFVSRGGKVLYSRFTADEEGSTLWAMNADGSDQRLLIGGRPGEPYLQRYFFNFVLSADGRAAVIQCEDRSGPLQSRTRMKALWSIQTDGTGLKRLPLLDLALAGDGKGFGLKILAWSASSNRLLLWSHLQDKKWGLWTYDLASGAQARLPTADHFWLVGVSPDGDAVVFAEKNEVKGSRDLFLIGIADGLKVFVTRILPLQGSVWGIGPVGENRWNRPGDRLAIPWRMGRGYNSLRVFVWRERRLLEVEGLPFEELIPQEPSSLVPSVDWLGEDMSLIISAPTERCLKVLGPDLAVGKKIPVPPDVGRVFVIRTADDKVLLQDWTNVAVWRLDLKTDAWKKVW